MSIHEIRVKSKFESNITHIYRFENITSEQAELIKEMALTDPVAETSQLNGDKDPKLTEIGYIPGVTDPIASSLLTAAKLLGIFPAAVSSSKEYESSVEGPNQIEEIVTQRPETLIYEGQSKPMQIIPILDLFDEQLLALSQNRSLFLTLEEMQVIQAHFRDLKRNPTDLELETLAQTWSEHCAHKTFKAILVDRDGNEKLPLFTRIKDASRKYFDRAEVITAFSDNSGGIRFYDGFVIIGKGETHNSPVAIVPYAGALTKNGGLYRDIAGTGKGGENLVSLMINNFAPPNTKPKPGSLPPKMLLLQNSRGEREYGNPMGIPTHAISLHSHPDFGPKPTSLGVAIGIALEKNAKKGKPKIGDLIIAFGGPTGGDGLHGATFSSGEMTGKTHEHHAAAVQLGDPIVERTMFDALLQSAHLINALTDCGAGGFASAIGEMADGIGARVQLNAITLKYSGLASWEKWLSESQERMVAAVSVESWEELREMCKRYNTEATVLGHFTGTNKLEIFDSEEQVGDLDLDFLHRGLPQRRMLMQPREIKLGDMRAPELPASLSDAVFTVAAHLNVCSKEEMHRQYDQTVQGMTILSPYCGVHQDVPNDGTVLAPIFDKDCGIVLTHALNPALNRIDPFAGSLWAFAHAATKYAAIGGDIDHAAGIDNFIWPFPDPESLGDLDASVDALCLMIDTLKIPMVSGKDSLSSTYRGLDNEVIKAPPSLNITLFGKIPDINKTVSCDFKSAHSCICLVGKPDINSMGGSVYFATNGMESEGQVPRVDLDTLPGTFSAIRDAMEAGKIKSAKAIGEGGLAMALAQMCFGGDCGAYVNLAGLGAKRADFALFNESAGCMLVEVENGKVANEIFADVAHVVIGFTTEERELQFSSNEMTFAPIKLDLLKESWQKPMKEILYA